jgi:hypothetical protein
MKLKSKAKVVNRFPLKVVALDPLRLVNRINLVLSKMA